VRKAEVDPRFLDAEVAVRLLGYRWVQWNPRGGGLGPSDEKGRFLYPPDGLLSHLQVPAGPEVPVADDPYRYLPSFCEDVAAAFEAARSAGLFGVVGAILNYHEPGEWSVQTHDGNVLARGYSLPEALCRASLRLAEAAPAARAG
jgi:hypothetical protein